MITSRISSLVATFMAGILLTSCGSSGGNTASGDIGGTGKIHVRGPITGFGSIIVGGVRFETDTAEVEIDDAPGLASELEVGQIVVITAQGSVALQIRYDAELEGPVDSVDSSNSRFTALGQTILVDAATVFENTSLSTLSPGDFVEISGERNANGQLLASYVELKLDDTEELEVTGLVTNHDPEQRRFSLNALTVDYALAAFEPADLSITNGQLVEAKGDIDADTGRLIATEIELEEADDDIADGDMAEIEGIIGELLSANSFTLAGFTVRHDDNTVFEDGTAAELQANRRVDVDGRFDADGVLVASEIEFEDGENRNLDVEIDAFAQSASDDSVTLLGITVQTSAETLVRDNRDDAQGFHIADIQPGDFIELRADDRDGTLVAGKVERDEAEDAIRLRGTLQSKDAATDMIVVQGVSVDVSAAQFEDNDSVISRQVFFDNAQLGESVDVDGSFDGNLITASEVERQP